MCICRTIQIGLIFCSNSLFTINFDVDACLSWIWDINLDITLKSSKLPYFDHNSSLIKFITRVSDLNPILISSILYGYDQSVVLRTPLEYQSTKYGKFF